MLLKLQGAAVLTMQAQTHISSFSDYGSGHTVVEVLI